METIYKKRYLVDTNIVIYTLKGFEEAVLAMEKLEDESTEVFYSTIVEAELFSFPQLTKKQKTKIRQILEIGEIIEVDSEVALKAAELRAVSSEQYNRKFKLPDAIIAATAMLNTSVLVTRNVNDFIHLQEHGLEIWNPFLS